MTPPSSEPLLEVADLRTWFPFGGRWVGRRRWIKAVDGVSLTLRRGEIFGLVGESGSGKTTLAMSVLGLIEPPGRVESGEVVFRGRVLSALDERQLDQVRGRQIGIVFQNALASLNPTFSVGAQITEVLQVHRGLERAAAKQQASDWLGRVGLNGFERSYPHQLSGGQAQRAMIGLALAPEPQLLIADEPTSALDVTVQSQIMQLMLSLAGPAGTTVLLITHDLGVLAHIAQRVGVLYDGQIVEQQPVDRLFASPQHPYTKRLIQALPKPAPWPAHSK